MQDGEENPIIFWESSSMDITNSDMLADEPSVDDTQRAAHSDAQISDSKCKVCYYFVHLCQLNEV